MGWEVFYQVFISFWQFHAQQSLYPRKEAIVITWPWSGEFSKRKSRNNNYPKLHPSQFDFYRNASPSRAPNWSRGSFSPYTPVSPHTCFPTHSTSHHYVCVPARKIFRLGIYLRSSTCRGMQLSSLIAVVRIKEVEAIGWTQLTLFSYVAVSLIISIDQSNWLDDKRSPSIYHQDNQSNWFDGKGPLSVCY